MEPTISFPTQTTYKHALCMELSSHWLDSESYPIFKVLYDALQGYLATTYADKFIHKLFRSVFINTFCKASKLRLPIPIMGTNPYP